ncbi:MAG: hypothetical protein KDD36_12125 [Flavobacteriales bacterium]|nr:hypothetical protein [Flavobacteriales bacterium]
MNKEIRKARTMPDPDAIRKGMDFEKVVSRMEAGQLPSGSKFFSVGLKTIGGLALVVTGWLLFSNTDSTIQQSTDASQPDVVIEKLADPGQHATYQPPFATLDIPFTTYQVNADSGRVIEHPGGSRILIPPHAFLDNQGEIFRNEAYVRYREFQDAPSICLSGISMKYDSVGQHLLESAGMMEIRAFNKNGEELFTNPAKPIQVELTSDDESTSYNLYKMNDDSGNWEYIGKDKVSVLETRSRVTEPETSNRKFQTSSSDETQMDTLALEIDSSQEIGVENLPGYKAKLNLFRPDDVEKIQSYNFRFTDISRKQPEMEPLDGLVWHYERSIQNQDEDLAFFEMLLSNRFKGGNYIYRYWHNIALTYSERNPTDYLSAHFSKDKTINIKLYPSLEGKFKDMTCGDIYRAYKNAWEAGERTRENPAMVAAKRKGERYVTTIKVNRSFALDGFGLYNCDKILMFSPRKFYATYKSRDGEELKIQNASVLISERRSVIRCFAKEQMYDPKFNCMMMMVLEDGRMAIVSNRVMQSLSRDYNKYVITVDAVGDPEELIEDLRMAGYFDYDGNGYYEEKINTTITAMP